MDASAHACREAISGLVEDRIYPIVGHVMDFLGFSTDRNSDRRFFDSPKNNTGDEFASKDANLNTIQHPDNRCNTTNTSNSTTGSPWNRVPESSPYNGTPQRLPPSGNRNGISSANQDTDSRRKFATPDRKSLQTPETRLDSSCVTRPCSPNRSQDVVNSNGYHANGSATKAKCDDNFFSGRRWLDFQIFSNQPHETVLGPKTSNPSDFASPLHHNHHQQQPHQSADTADSLTTPSGQLVPHVPDHQVTNDDPETTGPGEKLGRLQFSIAYDFQETTLTLRIIRAVDLVAKDFSGTSDPYVKIMLLPDKKRKLTTNVKRKNLNPRWNEVFAFEGFPYNKLLTRTLYLQVLDYDRFSRDDPIGEVCIPLGDFDLVRGQTLWKNLQTSKGHAGRLGEVNIGLCYQPTTGQLSVAIHEARQLKAKDINGLSDPYVKIWLLSDGKKTEKKKTATKERTLNPTFDETFVFTVPYERIRQTSLIVSVMDYDRMGRNEPIGQVLLGSKSGSMEVKHWNEMFAKTRQEVMQWHILKDFG